MAKQVRKEYNGVLYHLISCSKARPSKEYGSFTSTRGEVNVKAFASGDYSMTKIAKHFELYFSTNSRTTVYD